MKRLFATLLIVFAILAGLWPVYVCAPVTVQEKPSPVSAAPMRSCCKGVCHCCGKRSCCMEFHRCACCVQSAPNAVLPTGGHENFRTLPMVSRWLSWITEPAAPVVPEYSSRWASVDRARFSPPPELS